MIVVTTERNRFIQQRRNQTHAEAVLPSAAPQQGRLTWVWEEYNLTDGDGQAYTKRREKAALVTVLNVDGPLDIQQLGLAVAQACGHRTTQAFQEAWQVRHPRSVEATVVWFVLGDWRDRDTFMNWTGRAGGDYTRNPRRAMDPDAPTLTREEIDHLSTINFQKDTARRAEVARELAKAPPHQRLQRVYDLLEHIRQTQGEAAYRAAKAAIRQEERIMDQRATRAERRQ